MTVEYAVRFEGPDMVCQLIVDKTDYVEIHRIPNACQGDDTMLCALLIELCQQAAEWDAGQLLPWIWPQDDAEPSDLRVVWSGPLDRTLSC